MKLQDYYEMVLQEYYEQYKKLSVKCDLSGDKALEAVKKDGLLLRYVKDQTPEICLEAVKQDGDALQFVKNQTPEICLEAVRQDAYALQYVKDQTPEICLEAVNEDGYALKHVNENMFTKDMIEVSFDGEKGFISKESFESLKAILK